MTDAILNCEHCGRAVARVREAQRYCSKRCSVAAAVARHRQRSPVEVLTEDRPMSGTGRSAYSPQPPSSTRPQPTVREFTNGPTPGALQGDDYPLEYYDDGYPKLPACLDRRACSKHEVIAA
jgi:hypothetical protein